MTLPTFIVGCQDDDVKEPCDDWILDQITAYQYGECNINATEIFKIVEQPPMYGNGDEDLLNYLISDIDLCRFDEIEDGRIILKLVILKSGEPCLERVFVKKAPRGVYLPFVEKIEQMPFWEPGRQRDYPVIVQFDIGLKIQDSQIVLL